MKKGILLLLVITSVFANAQSLKETLYGGKLKTKPGMVVKKGDDLTALADSIQRIDSIRIADSIQKMDAARQLMAGNDSLNMMAPIAMDSSANRLTQNPDSPLAVTPNRETPNNNPDSSQPAADTASGAEGETAGAPKEAHAPKSNNVLWKEYVDSVSTIITKEVLPAKRIKRETYYITASYTIGTDGQVEVTDVSVSPENSLLQEQVKIRLNQDAPRLAPTLNSSGTPRKVSRRYNFTLTKE